MKYLDRFYREHPTVIQDRIIPIVDEQSRISLRFIENFVTKYCKEKPVFIKIGKRYINVYDDYKSQLNSYDKKKFDPFKRKHSKRPNRRRTARRVSTADIVEEPTDNAQEDSHLIFYPFSENKFVLTSIGQLNFFRWLLEAGVLDHIEKNYEVIKEEMNKMEFGKKERKDHLRNVVRQEFTIRTICPPNDMTLEKFKASLKTSF